MKIRGKPWTDEDLGVAVGMFNHGFTFDEIAVALSRPCCSVYNKLIAQMGLTRKVPPGRRVIDDADDFICTVGDPDPLLQRLQEHHGDLQCR